VHQDAGVLAGGQSDGAFGVEGVFAGADSPFVFCELSVIIGVNNGELSLGEGYASEGAAVAEASVEKSKIKDELVKQIRNFYGENNFDVRHSVCLWSNFFALLDGIKASIVG